MCHLLGAQALKVLRAGISKISGFPSVVTVIISSLPFMSVLEFQIVSIIYSSAGILFVSFEIGEFLDSLSFSDSSIPFLFSFLLAFYMLLIFLQHKPLQECFCFFFQTELLIHPMHSFLHSFSFSLATFVVIQLSSQLFSSSMSVR